MKKSITLAVFLFPIYLMAQDFLEIDGSWQYVTESKALKVYTRMPDDSNIKDLRILVEMTGHIDTLMSILNRAETFDKWVYKCSEGTKIEIPQGYQNAYAAITDFPFPFMDRELVAISKQWVDGDGRYHIHSVAAPEAIDHNDSTLRITDYEARWTIEQVTYNKIVINYVSSVDPGGNIPAWIVNMAITTGPLKTFSKLGELLEQNSYSNHTGLY